MGGGEGEGERERGGGRGEREREGERESASASAKCWGPLGTDPASFLCIFLILSHETIYLLLDPNKRL